MKALLLLLSITFAQEFCENMNYSKAFVRRNSKKVYSLAASDTEIYVIEREDVHFGTNNVARYEKGVWVPEDTNNARWDIAVDKKGNIAYISENQSIHMKTNGTWTSRTSRPDCAKKIKFAPDGQLWKVGCPQNKR